jgi:hypothetical protein
MPVQPKLFRDQPDDVRPSEPKPSPAPLWLQRISLFILVIFCVYLGVIVTVLPWWPSIWDHNMMLQSHPHLWAVLKLGFVRGIISGMGLLDIWIGISEAVHYRDHRS